MRCAPFPYRVVLTDQRVVQPDARSKSEDLSRAHQSAGRAAEVVFQRRRVLSRDQLHVVIIFRPMARKPTSECNPRQTFRLLDSDIQG
jgi:hypothetical protein